MGTSSVRYWWVNQNQTYRHEVHGGYLWSPKRNANGVRNPFYDFMREVAPADVVFSFALRPLLPTRYSPLRPTGAGLQNIYLTLLPDTLAASLIDLIGNEARTLLGGYRVGEEPSIQPAIGLIQWEEHEMSRVREDLEIPETERQAVVLARRGQGLFKQRVMEIESACRITGVTREEHLRASHCKPWRDASNAERLDGENGLLLSPNADHLFDRGFIGFENNGDVLISPVAHADSLARMGLNTSRKFNVGRFSQGQRQYLEFHRENVLLRSRFLETRLGR